MVLLVSKSAASICEDWNHLRKLLRRRKSAEKKKKEHNVNWDQDETRRNESWGFSLSQGCPHFYRAKLCWISFFDFAFILLLKALQFDHKLKSRTSFILCKYMWFQSKLKIKFKLTSLLPPLFNLPPERVAQNWGPWWYFREKTPDWLSRLSGIEEQWHFLIWRLLYSAHFSFAGMRWRKHERRN